MYHSNIDNYVDLLACVDASHGVDHDGYGNQRDEQEEDQEDALEEQEAR
jgi:hypothetical protein